MYLNHRDEMFFSAQFHWTVFWNFSWKPTVFCNVEWHMPTCLQIFLCGCRYWIAFQLEIINRIIPFNGMENIADSFDKHTHLSFFKRSMNIWWSLSAFWRPVRAACTDRDASWIINRNKFTGQMFLFPSTESFYSTARGPAADRLRTEFRHEVMLWRDNLGIDKRLPAM